MDQGIGDMVVSKFFKEFILRSLSAVFMIVIVILLWNLGITSREIMSLTVFSLLFLEWIFLFRHTDLSKIFLFAIGSFYILIAGIGFWDLLHHHSYHLLIPPIMLVLWTVDSGSYLIGSFLKGPKLAPSISAGKTWSGFFGGILLGYIVGYMFLFSSPLFDGHKDLAFIITFFLPFLGQLGDLLESKVKRILHVKDSSHLIPGHGGFLDRLDSALIIFFIWEIYIISKYFNIPMLIG